jgi:hypothetical protein
MEKMFELDVHVQSTTLYKEAEWFTESLFCTISAE